MQQWFSAERVRAREIEISRERERNREIESEIERKSEWQREKEREMKRGRKIEGNLCNNGVPQARNHCKHDLSPTRETQRHCAPSFHRARNLCGKKFRIKQVQNKTRELMAPRTDRTTRIPSGVASPITTNHAAKGYVFANLGNTSN